MSNIADEIKRKEAIIETSIEELYRIIVPYEKPKPKDFSDSDFNNNILYSTNILKSNLELIISYVNTPEVMNKAIMNCIKLLAGSKYDDWMLSRSSLREMPEIEANTAINACKKIIDSMYFIDHENVLEYVKEHIGKLYNVDSNRITYTHGMWDKCYIGIDNIKYNDKEYLWSGLKIIIYSNDNSDISIEYFENESFENINADEKITNKEEFDVFFKGVKQEKDTRNLFKDITTCYNDKIKRLCYRKGLDNRLFTLFYN